MGGSGSSSKRKSWKKKRDKKKKGRRKESKRSCRVYDSDDHSLNLEHALSSTSKSDHMRRINKNKKLRHDYLVSSYSDDSDSDSQSTYDSGYKRRKSKRSRVSLKSTKKRARKRSAGPSDDSGAHIVRKRKRSGRDRVVKRRKKSSNKKLRKHFSSSLSSDSESCSTCQSRSSSSTADSRHRRRVILDKEIEKYRGREPYKAEKKRKERSPSCSLYDRGSDRGLSVDHSIEPLSPVNNSRRLKSVIAVVDRPDDEGENKYEKDQSKEEIVYDQDDYPSPKSVDSNEEGSKMDLDYNLPRASNKRICVENAAGEEVIELEKSGTDEGDQNSAVDQSNEVHANKIEKEKEIDTPVPVADDLELILRQKALENLRKFRRGLQTGPRSTNLERNDESYVNRLSTRRVDDVQNNASNEGSSSAQEMNKRRGISLNRDFFPVTVDKKLRDTEDVAHPSDGAAVLGCVAEDKSTSSQAILAKPVSRSDTSPGAVATNAHSLTTREPASSFGPISGEHSSEQRNEAEDGSQYEQKTMLVMRGGEMVQVSYKVYIPKKAPALARRQLKR